MVFLCNDSHALVCKYNQIFRTTMQETNTPSSLAHINNNT